MVKKTIFLLCFLFLYNVLYSQDHSLSYYKSLNISNGLTHNGVTSIFKDSKGFVWIATYDGLNKYDGYRIKQYKNTFKKTILNNNRVRVVEEDDKGNLLIGTDSGLTVYNIEQERFTKLYSTSTKELKNEPIITKITIHPKTKEIVCSTEGNGLYVFNANFVFQGQYQYTTEINNKKWILNSILLDEENYLFVTSFYAILFNIKTKELVPIRHPKLFNCSFVKKYNQNTFYVGNIKGGVTFFTYKSIAGNCEFKQKKRYLKTQKFICANVDYKNQLWLGGKRGEGALKISDIHNLKNQKEYDFNYFLGDSKKLRVSTITSFDDKYVWVGSFNEGVFLINLKRTPFYTGVIEYDKFLSIIKKDNHHIYVNDKLNKTKIFNFQKKIFKSVTSDVLKKNVRIIYVDSKENTWIAISKRKKEIIGRILKDSNSIDTVLVQPSVSGKCLGVVEDNKHNIWLSYNKNVYRINVNKNQKIENIEDLSQNPSFKTHDYVANRFLYVDPVYNYLWIGDKTDGLVRVQLKAKQKLEKAKIDYFVVDKTNPNSITSNFVSSIVRLQNKELWIGTEGGGICRVEDDILEKPKFNSFTEEEGLSNNVVKDILVDSEQNLWITTNNGLNKFNVKNKTFRSFTKNEGLPFENFYFGSKKISENNFVLLGNERFCYFNTKSIIDSEEIPSLTFGELSIYNKVINVNDTINGRVLLKHALTDGQEIELKASENFFALEVIPLHYANPKNYTIKYRLHPLYKKWIRLSQGKNSIEFNGLPAGDYVLEVKTSNSLKQWSTSKKILLKVKPKFWKSNTAYILYILIGLVLIYIVFQIFYKIQKLNHKLEIEQLEKDKLKDVNESKLRFFSNITHEIKTPIALISGPVDLLLDKIKSNQTIDTVSKLMIVKRQAHRISQLIDQVRDFQQSDANQLKIKYESFCFDDFLERLVIDFEFLAKSEHKKLVINNLSDKKIIVSADKDKIEKVLNNLFSNSFKYTQSGDIITIDYKEEGNSLLVSFQDTGKGIAPDDLPHVFERFYQSKRMTKEYIGGSGIGLAFSKRLVEMHYGHIYAKSELGEGTTMHLDLPIIDVNVSYENHVQEVLSKEQVLETTMLDTNFSTLDVSTIASTHKFSEARIFYAEDNLDLRNFVQEILANFFKVTVFTNGAECLSAMQQDWPDLVLTDVLMPELNGFELCKEIKQNIKTSHIPVVMLTACISDEEQIRGINGGVDAYIKKPFQHQRLISTIESLLKNREILKERFKGDFPLELEKSSQSKEDIVFIDNLYQLMVENLDNKDLDMDELAKRLYLNRTHFYQRVKKITNQTPYELLKDFRVKKAAEFLIRDKLTVNEVFVETGFKSRSHFSKVFKDKYGVTPGQYVKNGIQNL